MKFHDVTKLKSVYIGGGTPSILSPLQIEKLLSCVSGFVSSASEISIEINPDDLTKEKLSAYEKSGINRLSLGIQAFGDDVLKKVNRRSDTEKNLSALNLVSRYWKNEFSADLISALPFQTEENFIYGIKTLLSFKPHHVSLYSLTIEEGTPLFSAVENHLLDYDNEKASELWIKGRDFLEKNGYEQYEVSNFYRKSGGKKCVHNLSYWNQESYIGCGSGATGTIYENHENESYRYTNTKNIDKYIKFWGDKKNDFLKKHEKYEEKEILSLDTLSFEYFMMGLRKTNGISISQFINKYGRKRFEKIEGNILEWKKNGLAEISLINGDEFFFLNKKGLLFLNQFLLGI